MTRIVTCILAYVAFTFVVFAFGVQRHAEGHAWAAYVTAIAIVLGSLWTGAAVSRLIWRGA